MSNSTRSTMYATNRRLFAPPLLFLLIGWAISLFAYFWIQAEHRSEVQRTTAEKAEVAVSEITAHLQYRLQSLARMANRWNATGGYEQKLWESDASAYLRDQPEFQSLVILSADALVQWVVPSEQNKRYIGKSLAFEPRRSAAIEQARSLGKMTNSGVVELVGGSKAIVFVLPLYSDGLLNGFLVGAYDMPQLMQSIVPNIGLQEFETRFLEEGAPVFVRNESSELIVGSLATLPLDITGTQWEFQIVPHQSFANDNELIEYFVVSLGIVATLFLAVSAYFILLNIERTRRETEVARRTQLTIDRSQVGIWEWFDTKDTAQYWSPELYKMFGYVPGEIEASYDNFEDLIHPDDRVSNNRGIRTSLDVQNAFRIESRMRKKDGAYEWFEFRGSRTFNESGGEYFFATCVSIREQKAAEQRSADAYAFQDLIFENIPALLFVKDAQYRIVNANPAFLSVYPPEMRDSVIGTTTLEKYSQEEAEDFLRDDRLAFAHGTREIEETVDFPDGVRRTLATKKVRFENAAGERFILGVAHDITEIRRVTEKLEQSETEFRSAMENSAAGMALLSPAGEWLSVNAALCEILGYSPQELRETTFQALTHPDDIDVNLDSTAKMLSGKLKRYQVEKRYIHKDGHTIWALLTTALVRNPDGTPRHFISQVLDITATKAFEQALVRSNKDLDDFAYIASHDLKEPLRGIHNYSRFLTEDYEDALDEDGQHKLGRIMHLTQRMEALINDLLQYSRLGRETNKPVAVDMHEIIEDIEDMLPDQDQSVVKLALDLPTIVGDEVQIRELFRNLITNGIKYNQSEEKNIEVGLAKARKPEHQNKTILYVKDNGIGIEKRFHGDIFKMFKRLHHRDKFGGGSGAGLAFVKKIVDRLHGEIWLESEVGKGSTFYVALPNDPEV